MNLLIFFGACVAVAVGSSYESLEISDEFSKPDSSSEENEKRFGGGYAAGPYNPPGSQYETLPQYIEDSWSSLPNPEYRPLPGPIPPGPVPLPQPWPPGPSPPGSIYPPGPIYPGPIHAPGYNDFRKLKSLRGENIVKAKLRYYKKDNQNFVVISCPRNPNSGAYTWILADSNHRATPSFGIPDTIALAAGLNVEFIAKLNQHQKWEGRDMTNDDKHRFRRVGCFHGATQSFVKN